MYIFRHYFNIFYFQNDINTIAANIETNYQKDIYICFNKNCDKMQLKNGVYSYKLNQQKPILYKDIVNNIEIISDEIFEFNSISLFKANKLYYFKPSDISQKKVEFNSKYAYSINLPQINNNKTFIQKTGVYIESIFYNWYFYFLFYIFVLICILKFKPSIKLNIFSIIFLAILLRLSHINFIPLWNDELYTLTFISDMGNDLNLKNVFLDPGNPPLFFIISNIWLYLFNKNITLIRLLPLITGGFCIYSIYWVANNLLNKKTALIASFLSAINIFMILESNEIRSYILAMTLVVWNLYFFFKLKNNFSNKNLLCYCILSAFVINTHYYCVLYVLFNFIYGLFFFKERKKYIFSNIPIFLSFAPYFIISNKFALSANFNTWIEKPTLDVISNHITFYFGNIIFLLITTIFCIYFFKMLSDKEKSIFKYTSFCITFVFILAYLISVFIKPVLFERYFCIFIPYLIINTAVFLNLNLNPILLLLIFLFSVNMPKYENFNLFSNINFAMQYAAKDSVYYKEQNIYFVIPDNISYIKYFPNIDKSKVVVSKYGVREDIDLVQYYLNQIKEKNNIILYLPEICINSKIKYSNNLDVKRINTTIVPIYKIVIK